ncbi:hypothetical protein [Mesorhizobium sp. LNJC394B00]|uniref:hypothetical protein n=1 Tax=unclassified Mesorhizobium TaxID=325217 RepID=UPI0003CE190D|nr:hypothetical protein [Mesorhizobium sp. LNJC394B00]ESY20704.1 hypothetical protein X750_18450 [Mesorhizobium sp. LNJC394B00]
MKTLQQAADDLMEAMQDEADLARLKDQALLDALTKRAPQQPQEGAAKSPDVATRKGSQ